MNLVSKCKSNINFTNNNAAALTITLKFLSMALSEESNDQNKLEAYGFDSDSPTLQIRD